MTTTPKFEREDVMTMRMPRAFAKLVASATRLDLATSPPADIEGLLRGAGLDDASLAPFINFAPDRYTRNCVYRDERFELLVLCWAPGARSAIHDHGGSHCFVNVLRGALTVENYALLEHGHAPGPALLGHTDTLILNPGALDARYPESDVHRVSALGGAAVSLHLYARPLDTCLVFDLAQKACRGAINRYDRPAGALPAAVVPHGVPVSAL